MGPADNQAHGVPDVPTRVVDEILAARVVDAVDADDHVTGAKPGRRGR